jgi:predicted ATPase
MIRLWGRNLTVPRSAGHVAQFSFAELCGRALGAADYLEVTQRFRTLFVKDVPRMGLSEKDKVDGVRISTSHLLMLTFAYIGSAIHYVH